MAKAGCDILQGLNQQDVDIVLVAKKQGMHFEGESKKGPEHHQRKTLKDSRHPGARTGFLACPFQEPIEEMQRQARSAKLPLDQPVQMVGGHGAKGSVDHERLLCSATIRAGPLEPQNL
jgi:hypothetical protein